MLPSGFEPEEHYAKNKEFKIIEHNQLTFEPQIGLDYLIITSETLWDSFNAFKEWKPLNDDKISTINIINVSEILLETDCWVAGQYGDATNESNGNPWIEDGKEITSDHYALFNDTQCKIRNYIRKMVTESSLQYVLLAGNKDHVPVRMVCTYAHSGPDGGWYNDTSHASDMYYSNLDYNMNNNTNSYWMENTFGAGIYWANVTQWDEIDWQYDVLVGRVLVSTIEQANNWIHKTEAYAESNDIGYLQSGVVAAKDPSNQIDDYVWSRIGDEFPEDISFVNGQQITQQQWNILDDYCNGIIDGWNGIAFMYHSGHGGTLYTPYQPSALSNDDIPNFLYTEGCNSGDYGTDTSSRAEQWMRDNGGIFSGITNSAYGWFIASTWYSEEMFNLMFNQTTAVLEPIFSKAHYDARENVGWELHSVAPMIFKQTNFLGDPSLEFNWYEEPPVPPIISNPSPANGTINCNLALDWNITIEDPKGYNFTLNLSCSNGQWAYWNTTNGTYGLAVTSLENNTWYTMTVIANNTEGAQVEEWFNFRTKPESYPPWDFNEDGWTNYLDVSILVEAYGDTGPPGWIPSDLNSDGLVNYLDASIIIDHYGETY